MDKFEEFVQKVGMAKVTPEDLSWIVAYTTTLRSRLKALFQDRLDAARDAFESEEPLAVGRYYVTGHAGEKAEINALRSHLDFFRTGYQKQPPHGPDCLICNEGKGRQTHGSADPTLAKQGE